MQFSSHQKRALRFKEKAMILRIDSLTLRVLMFIASPTCLLPPLLPLCVEHARVGDNTADYVRVRFVW
jgi:hypothetical protein